jgi:hypothetical protein
MLKVKEILQHRGFILEILKNPRQRKHIFQWIESKQESYLLKNKLPWLVYDAINYLKIMNLEGKKVFEYGSGGSTLFWLSQNTICVSIEHDPNWYTLLRSQTQPNSLIDYRLVLPKKVETSLERLDPADPNHYISNNVDYYGYSFINYVSEIDTFPDGYFDVVLIDGRARPSCIKHSVRKIKGGGLIILDNSDREYYLRKTNHYFTDFNKLDFCGVAPTINYQIKTSIFIRKM